ncbi:MAG TPA: oxygenase MpaB family protein, partial [Pseudonocardia sp.]|uniref:oxygenase MpaB family protein n=1 Tax=Pseudonocardia sp. TaxID=60912 RepID=UPI002CE809AC
TALRGKAMFGDPKTIPQDEMPGWLWRLVAPLPIRFSNFLSRGLMPPIIREKMNYPWTPADERRFRRAARVLRAVVPRLPARVRYNPIARAAFERDGWPTP